MSRQALGTLLDKLQEIRPLIPRWITAHPRFAFARLAADGKTLDFGLVGTTLKIPENNLFFKEICKQKCFSLLLKRHGVSFNEHAYHPYFQHPSIMVQNRALRAPSNESQEQPTFSSCTKIGTEYLGTTPDGTLGWLICLNGKMVGITCLHVVSQRELEPQLPVHVFGISDSQTHNWIGQATCCDELSVDGPNRFDFSLISVDETVNLSGKMHLLGDRPIVLGNPQRLGSIREFDDNEIFYSVGGDSFGGPRATCFQGVGLVRRPYKQNISGYYLLENQLFFCQSASKGDSGGLILDSSKNLVFGLIADTSIVTKIPTFTIASPLLLKGWHPTAAIESSVAGIPSLQGVC